VKHLYWTGTLENINSSLTVDEIKAKCDKYTLQDAGVGFENKVQSIRSTGISFVNDPQISHMLWELAHTVNKHSFGFEIESPPNIQYTVYEKGDHYDWHVDTHWANQDSLYDRKISIIIQLTDYEDYSGGDLELDTTSWDGSKEFCQQKGAILVFPSFLRHRVTPVTKGTRKSLVAWIEGRCFR
tara:strand:- start:1512 stop:2063 length:552 start_codon:yes stop_codon:yes gene_type:complete